MDASLFPFPTPPPRRKRNKARSAANNTPARSTNSLPVTMAMRRNDPEGASSSPDHRHQRRSPLSLDVTARGHGPEEHRPRSAEPPRRSSEAANEFLLQKPNVPRRNSIAGSIVSMLADIKPISLADMLREKDKKKGKKRTRTRSSSLAGCEEVAKEEMESSGMSAAEACTDIPSAVETDTTKEKSMPTDKKNQSDKVTKPVKVANLQVQLANPATNRPVQVPKMLNQDTNPSTAGKSPASVPNPSIQVVDTSELTVSEVKPVESIVSKQVLEDEGCCSKLQQPTHVKLPDVKVPDGKEKAVKKLTVSFDDMDGPSKTSVYVSPSVSPVVSTATIDSSSVTNDTLDIFECGICTEPLTIPKSLPCLHNFCLQCLEKYFSANQIEDGQEFRCPSCRARAVVPGDGGAIRFPTNFHIENLRKRAKRKNTDVEGIVNDALAFLEQREIDIIETLTERKRMTFAAMGSTRERFVTALDNYLEELQVTIEDQYHKDSTHIVTVIHKMRDKLEQLQSYLTADETESDAVEKLRQQGEVITNVANELEEIKSKVKFEVDKVLRYHLKFQLGDSDSFRFSTQLGKLISTRVDEQGREIDKNTKESNFVTRVYSWWMLIIGLLPALVFCYLIKLIVSMGAKK